VVVAGFGEAEIRKRNTVIVKVQGSDTRERTIKFLVEYPLFY
jgi:hypothetical protein